MSSIKIDTLNDVRKTLLRNGYVPLAGLDKTCRLKNWATIAVTEETIREWSRKLKRQTTNIRIEPPLGFIDNDISIERISAAVIDGWAAFLPEVLDPDRNPKLLERGTTASCKVAYFVRLSEPFKYLSTHEFMDGDGKTHKVEIWGGGGSRQAGVFGPHTVGKDGKAVSTYTWALGDDGEPVSLLTVPIGELPSLSKAECVQLITIAEETMRDMGLKQVEKLTPDDGSGDTVYDIVDSMVFESADSVYSLAELKELLADVDSIRLTGTWHDPASQNTDRPRCIARLGYDGGLLVTDFGEDGKKHREVPGDDEEATMAAFAAFTQQTPEPGKDAPQAKNPPGHASRVAKMLITSYCYCPSMGKTPVVPIAHPDQPMAMTNFRDIHVRNGEEEIGPRGGISIINPVNLWLASKKLIIIDGVQMRADQTKFFKEDNRHWLNTYRRPAHDSTGGNSRMLWALIEQIAPHAEERRWLVQHMAHKFLHPEIPGPAVIMLAQDEFGTGRGTFMQLLGKLHGEAYVAQLPAHLFTGSSYQSQYTEWLADNVIVCVEEMIELKGGTKWSAKHDLYERLKELIEPRMKRRKIVRRGTKAREEMVSCSFYAFLNNLDDIPIHERDRRCFALRNGVTRDEAFWKAVNSSIENAADVAAFAAELAKVDLTGYSPYAPPPVTEAKLAMADIAKSDIEAGLDTVLARLRGQSELISMLHVVKGMDQIRSSDCLNYPAQWESWVGRIVGKRLFRVGIRDGANWKLKLDGHRWATFAWSRELAEKWKTVDGAFVIIELAKAGVLKGGYGSTPAFNWPTGEPDGNGAL